MSWSTAFYGGEGGQLANDLDLLAPILNLVIGRYIYIELLIDG